MKKRITNLTTEIVYLCLIVLVTVIFSFSTHTPGYTYIMAGVLGLVLLVTWFIRAFTLYSGRKISKYSEVIQRISLRDRFFAYFILPSIFYISTLAFLHFNTSTIMEYIIIGIFSIQIFILFLNVRSSLSKIYTLEAQTKAIFDFICISIFFLIESVLTRLGLSAIQFILATSLLSFVLLFFDLKLHSKESLSGILMTLVSSIFISIFVISFWKYSIFTIPAVATVAYYLVISLWNVRFAGKIKLYDYILPFLYSIITIIFILNI